jgi:hypothetical protein
MILGREALLHSRTISLPLAKRLSQRHCDVCTPACGAVSTCVSNKTDTTLNIYCSVCTDICGVPYACVVLWTCNILPQLATLQRCFCTSTLKHDGLFCCTCFIAHVSPSLSLPYTLETASVCQVKRAKN